jgi:hypothetical protein
MSAAIGNTVGIIDFVDAQAAGLQAAGGGQVPAGMVVGGPPAYLEAHGIRYVPASTLGAEAPPMGADGADDAADGLDSRADPAPIYVSKRELDARVDGRIRQFMSGSSGEPVRRSGSARTAAAAASPSDDVRARLKALREECEKGLSSAASAAPGRVLRSGRRVPPVLEDYEF